MEEASETDMDCLDASEGGKQNAFEKGGVSWATSIHSSSVCVSLLCSLHGQSVKRNCVPGPFEGHERRMKYDKNISQTDSRASRCVAKLRVLVGLVLR